MAPGLAQELGAAGKAAGQVKGVRDEGMSLQVIRGSLSLRERVGVRELVATLAIAGMGGFMESPPF